MARYQYETSPRKFRTDYDYSKERKHKSSKKVNKAVKTQAKTKLKLTTKLKLVFLVVLGFAAFFAISYRNAVIDYKYAEIKALKADLAAVQKENDQLEATIESRLNLKTIQTEAEDKLGMKTLDNNQTTYISLPKTDYVESVSEEIKSNPTDGYIQKAIKYIRNLVK